MPTFAKLSGADVPADRTIDGRSIWNLLTEPDAKSPRNSYFYYQGGMRYRAEDGPPKNDPRLEAVREGPWKLFVETVGEEREVKAKELYNLHEDVGERLDYAAKHPEVVERLTTKAQDFNDRLREDTRPLGRLAGSD